MTEGISCCGNVLIRQNGKQMSEFLETGMGWSEDAFIGTSLPQGH